MVLYNTPVTISQRFSPRGAAHLCPRVPARDVIRAAAYKSGVTPAFAKDSTAGVSDTHPSLSCSLSNTPTMLSRVSSSVARSTAYRSVAARASISAARRTYVQPSGADRASVVDVPSTYQEDAYFSPRSGTHGQRMAFTSIVLTIVSRYARLQARDAPQGGLREGQDTANLPRHAGPSPLLSSQTTRAHGAPPGYDSRRSTRP